MFYDNGYIPATPSSIPTEGNQRLLPAYTLEEAQTWKNLAEANKANKEAEAADLLVKTRKVEYEQAEWSHRLWRGRTESKSYFLLGEIDPLSAAQAMDALADFHRMNEEAPITLYINSPGGDVISGMAIYDYIQLLRRRWNHHVTTVAIGYAASMAGVILQAGDVRAMTKESWLMLHEAQFSVSGKTSDVFDRAKFVERVQHRVVDIFSERSGASPDEIRTAFERRDMWLSSDDALERKFIDEIR